MLDEQMVQVLFADRETAMFICPSFLSFIVDSCP